MLMLAGCSLPRLSRPRPENSRIREGCCGGRREEQPPTAPLSLLPASLLSSSPNNKNVYGTPSCAHPPTNEQVPPIMTSRQDLPRWGRRLVRCVGCLRNMHAIAPKPLSAGSRELPRGPLAGLSMQNMYIRMLRCGNVPHGVVPSAPCTRSSLDARADLTECCTRFERTLPFVGGGIRQESSEKVLATCCLVQDRARCTGSKLVDEAGVRIC